MKFNWYTQLLQKGWKQAAMQRGQPALRLFEQGFAQIAEGFAQKKLINIRNKKDSKIIFKLFHFQIPKPRDQIKLSHCFIASSRGFGSTLIPSFNQSCLKVLSLSYSLACFSILNTLFSLGSLPTPAI